MFLQALATICLSQNGSLRPPTCPSVRCSLTLSNTMSTHAVAWLVQVVDDLLQFDFALANDVREGNRFPRRRPRKGDNNDNAVNHRRASAICLPKSRNHVRQTRRNPDRPTRTSIGLVWTKRGSVLPSLRSRGVRVSANLGPDSSTCSKLACFVGHLSANNFIQFEPAPKRTESTTPEVGPS